MEWSYQKVYLMVRTNFIQYRIGGVLLAVGIVLWFVTVMINRSIGVVSFRFRSSQTWLRKMIRTSESGH